MTAVPHWDDSPHWALWLAQDGNGCWFWFEDEPSAHRTFMRWHTGALSRCQWARKTPLYEPWDQTKRRYGK